MKNNLPIKTEFPEEFFQEEERGGIIIPSSLKNVWAVELDLLLEFDKKCKELNIHYFLDSGTLLGAVRSGHFIPWDDDIDVIMLRQDYDKLISDNTVVFNYPYFLQSAYSDNGYFRGHSQLRNSETCAILPQELGKVAFNQGIFIDIFVLDGICDDLIPNQIEKRKKLLRIKNIISDSESSNFIKQSIKRLLKIVYKRKYSCVADIYREIEQIYSTHDDTEYVDKILFRRPGSTLKRLKREWFQDTVYIPFEGIMCPIPKESDKVLREYYGDDYMTPKRNVGDMHHKYGDVLFDPHHSYKEVLKNRGL